MKKATLQERKEKAIELMKELNIYKPYIVDFKEKDRVTYFDNYIGYWAFQNKALDAKVKEIEKEYDITVYAITHEFPEFGECFSFLYVSNDKTTWEGALTKVHNGYYFADVYTWVKDDDSYSEFGTLGVRSALGGIKRLDLEV